MCSFSFLLSYVFDQTFKPRKANFFQPLSPVESWIVHVAVQHMIVDGK